MFWLGWDDMDFIMGTVLRLCNVMCSTTEDAVLTEVDRSWPFTRHENERVAVATLQRGQIGDK